MKDFHKKLKLSKKSGSQYIGPRKADREDTPSKVPSGTVSMASVSQQSARSKASRMPYLKNLKVKIEKEEQPKKKKQFRSSKSTFPVNSLQTPLPYTQNNFEINIKNECLSPDVPRIRKRFLGDTGNNFQLSNIDD